VNLKLKKIVQKMKILQLHKKKRQKLLYTKRRKSSIRNHIIKQKLLRKKKMHIVLLFPNHQLKDQKPLTPEQKQQPMIKIKNMKKEFLQNLEKEKNMV